ncbi:MAG TPA: hypothetical protein VIF62_19430 [Labilithrix sp.]|jgi:hypothetical protein
MIRKALGFLSFGAVLFAFSPASAEETKKVEKDEANGKEEKPEADEHAGIAYADFVLGFGKVPLAIQNPPTTTEPLPRSHAGAGQITTESIVFGAMYEFFPKVGIGARIPVSFAELNPNGEAGRSTSSVGNLEIVAEHTIFAQSYLSFFIEGGISLPTASGQRMPEDVDTRTPEFTDRSAFDHGAVNKAASLARGGADTALYAMDYLGVNPQGGVVWNRGKLKIAGMAKVENLFSTSGQNSQKYVGELVPRAKIAYRVTESLEPTFQAYAPITFAGAEPGEDKVGVVVEPQLAAYAGALRPTLGVIIPVVGPASDPQAIGVRLALAAVF